MGAIRLQSLILLLLRWKLRPALLLRYAIFLMLGMILHGWMSVETKSLIMLRFLFMNFIWVLGKEFPKMATAGSLTVN